jgi:hypothetical protein
MEAGHETGMISAIQAFRMVYNQQNSHLSEDERDAGWKTYWTNSIAAKAGLVEPPTIVPSKRTASSSSFGSEPASKRPGLVGCPYALIRTPGLTE